MKVRVYMNILKSVSLVFCITYISACFIWADDVAQKGKAIAIESDKNDQGFVDQVAIVEMVLTNRHGQHSSRKMKSSTLEKDGEGDKTLILFEDPKDIKGTAFLSHTHILDPDDQWLFLPALKRVKRISSKNKSGPFMGSEFAYEDINSQEVEKYTYKYISEEEYEGKLCHKVERYPKDPRSGYTKQVAWYAADNYLLLKVDYYDRKSKRLKTLFFKDYKEYLPNVWRAHVYHMVNHQVGKETVLTWSNFKFKNGLSDRDFDKNSLKRAR